MRTVLIVVVAVMALGQAAASESWIGLAGVIVALVVWRLAEHRFERHHSLRILTSAAYVGIAAAMLALTTMRHPDDLWWVLCGVAVTIVLAIRTAAQETFLRSRRTSRVQVGRSTFSETQYLAITSPPVFRWAHRVLALWWVWHLVSMATAMRPREEWDNAWGYILPAFALLLFGPAAAIPELVLFPVTLLFLSTGPAVLWVLSDLAWFFYSTLRRPTDRRTNLWRGMVSTSRQWPWYYPT